MVLDWISQEYLPLLLDGFLNPQKRVSLFYLALAVLIALAWSVYVSRGALRDGFRDTIRKLFGKRVLFSRSARADYKLLLINQAVLLLAAPLFVSKIVVATALFFFFQEAFPGGTAVLASAPAIVVAIAYTVFLFVFDDFSRFITHFALHRIQILWAFHKVHHSAETLSPLTVYRTHPVEAVIFSFRAIGVQAVSISLFVFLFGSAVDLVTVYGTNLFLFIFNATGANLRHSHIQIRYGRVLEHVLISPAQHQIHHSLDPRHHDRNFGAALAIWDWVAGSLCVASREMTLVFGLSDRQPPETHSLLHLYVSPFAELISHGLRIAGARTAGGNKNRKWNQHAL